MQYSRMRTSSIFERRERKEKKKEKRALCMFTCVYVFTVPFLAKVYTPVLYKAVS